MKNEVTLFWFRRDLRLFDNKGLLEALCGEYPVLPIFIFDTEILSVLPKKDRRVKFIHQELLAIKQELQLHGSDLKILVGKVGECFGELVNSYEVKAVYTNRDYEPQAIERDKNIKELLAELSIPFYDFKDQVIFDKEEVLKPDNTPYTVFTPYSKKWKEVYTTHTITLWDSVSHLSNLLQVVNPQHIVTLNDIGFEDIELTTPKKKISDELIVNYPDTRDYPFLQGTSRLSVHLRFGTVSIRGLALQAMQQKNEKFLNELIWREFYQMILYHFPYTTHNSFKKQFDNVQFENNEEWFALWCAGKTGYPIVDAGMRELNETGYMHNRVRMIVASFLCKDLLIDWRWGERYFAEKLLDYELASNVGGWQWAAGCGCDAAPYFRIFNPYLQADKFDSEKIYIKKWIPEYGTDAYPKPIVSHEEMKSKCLEMYKVALS